MKGKWSLLTVIVIVGMLLAPASVALAAEENPPQPQGRGSGIRGEVTAVAGHTLTVRTARGEALVVTGEGTIFRVPGVEEPSIEDIVVGDRVAALGQRVGRVFRARLVAVIDPDARPGRVGGQVTAVEGSDIMVSAHSGETAVVRTDADTAFRIPGVENPGLDDVQVGVLIGAAGTWNEDDSLQAAIVVVPREMERRTRLNGEVAAIEGATLTVSTGGGRQVAILTDDGTSFHVPGVDDASLADVQVGDRVTVGVETREAALYALTVVVLPEQAGRVGGQVTSIDGSTLTLETQHGAVQVLTDGSTIFRVPDVEDATLDDVRVGDRVLCGGSWEDETTFYALGVQVRHGSTAPGRPGTIRGRVTAVGSDQLTVGTAHGPVIVLVSAETELQVPDVENPSLSDIHVGDGVGAQGQWNEDGSLEANTVRVLGGANQEGAALPDDRARPSVSPSGPLAKQRNG